MQGIVQPLNEKGLFPIDLSPEAGECDGCASKGICKLPAAERIEVPPEQLPQGIHAGDPVHVDMPPGFRVRLAFSIFILPLLLMLAGAVLGGLRGERWAMACGFGGLLAGILCSWLIHRGQTALKLIHITRC